VLRKHAQDELYHERLIYITGTTIYPCMVEPSSTYRLRALASEQHAREASNPAIKKEWEDLAIQWHLIAYIAAELRGHLTQIDSA
jgi:hypothetical protein